MNHSWHVALHVTANGFSTLALPDGGRSFQIDFDFVRHRLMVSSSDGGLREIPLAAISVAGFFEQLMAALDELGIAVEIAGTPNELADATPFHEDHQRRAYDPQYAHRFWRVVLAADEVLHRFRARFCGKSSPVHFFWGNMDLALTRFSGRPAPMYSGSRPHLPDWVLRDAYSHECFECGFWPGEAENPQPLFYALAYPELPAFRNGRVRPAGARYSDELKEFVLPYEEVRRASSPESLVLEFLQSGYELAAEAGHWDRAALDYHRPDRR